MPRKARIRLDNVPLHIVQRGHNRLPCFHVDADRLVYLHCLDQAAADTVCQLHAYVLMTNHVHLLLTPSHADGVSTLFGCMGRYVQYFNRRHGRNGTLWDSRYKSSLVDSDDYLLECHRYIELNPVRAGIVAEPSQYRWSSYHRNALGTTDARISPHPVYVGLGTSLIERQAAYRALFASQLSKRTLDEIRRALNRNHPLGSPAFIAEVESATGRSFRSRRPGRPRRNSAEPADEQSGTGPEFHPNIRGVPARSDATPQSFPE